jgi:uncharacterized protein (TIGR00730 family)
MKICVFCSANEQIDPDFFRAAEELGRWAATNGHVIVYGGVNQGLMESIARAVSEGGGRVVGVVPRIVETSGRTSQYVEVEIRCDDLTDRKQLMMDHSDLFVALPGGIGTLDELIETLVLVKLGRLDCRIAAVNVDGFYDPLKALLDHYVATNMLEPADRALISFPSTVEEFEALL